MVTAQGPEALDLRLQAVNRQWQNSHDIMRAHKLTGMTYQDLVLLYY